MALTDPLQLRYHYSEFLKQKLILTCLNICRYDGVFARIFYYIVKTILIN